MNTMGTPQLSVDVMVFLLLLFVHAIIKTEAWGTRAAYYHKKMRESSIRGLWLINLFEDRHAIELLGVELKKTQLKRDLYETIRKRKQERLNAMEDDNEEDDNEEEEKEEEEIADEEGKKEDEDVEEDVKTDSLRNDGSSDFLNFSQQNNVVSKFFDSSFINDMFKNIENIEDDSVVASFDKRKEDAVAVTVSFLIGEKKNKNKKRRGTRGRTRASTFSNMEDQDSIQIKNNEKTKRNYKPHRTKSRPCCSCLASIPRWFFRRLVATTKWLMYHSFWGLIIWMCIKHAIDRDSSHGFVYFFFAYGFVLLINPQNLPIPDFTVKDMRNQNYGAVCVSKGMDTIVSASKGLRIYRPRELERILEDVNRSFRSETCCAIAVRCVRPREISLLNHSLNSRTLTLLNHSLNSRTQNSLEHRYSSRKLRRKQQSWRFEPCDNDFAIDLP